MGTKVQCKSYLPGYYTTRDLNEDATHSWPLYYEDVVPNGQFYGAFPPRLMNGYTDFDKEELKQTMLNQEAVFRKQVHELHRLYRKQRELMEELKQKEACHYALQSQSSLPSSSSQNKFADDAERSGKAPHLWDINCNHSGQSGSGMETSDPFRISNNGSRQASVRLTDSGDSLKKSDMDSKPAKCPRIMIDLQLPANVYMDSDVEKTGEGQGALSLFHELEYPSTSRDPGPGKDLNLDVGCSGNTGHGESWQKASRLQDAQSSMHSNFNDLVPINVLNHGVSPAFLSKYSGGKDQHEEVQGHRPLPSYSSFADVNNFHYLHRGAGSSHLDQFAKESVFPERSSHLLPNLPGGASMGQHRLGHSGIEKSNLSSFLMPSNMKMAESGCQERLGRCNNGFGARITGTSYPTLSSSMPTGPSHLVPLSGHLGIPSPHMSSQRKTMHGTPFTPINVDALPLFNEPVFPNEASNSSKSIFSSGCVLANRSLTSNRSFSSEVSSYPNGFPHDLNYLSCRSMPPTSIGVPAHNYGAASDVQNHSIHKVTGSLRVSENRDMKPLQNVDLNLDVSCNSHDELPAEKQMVLREPKIVNAKPSGGPPWLRPSSSREPPEKIDDTVQPIDTSGQNFRKMEQESFHPSDVAGASSVLAVDSTQRAGPRPSDSAVRRCIIDLEKPAPEESSVEDGFHDIASGQRNLINLNLEPADTTRSSRLEIDLEAPAIPDIDDEALHCKETLELDQLALPTAVPKQVVEDANAEIERPGDETSVVAAEIIVAISSCIAAKPSGSAESLMWFADVVCANNIDEQSNICDGVSNEDFDSDSADFFESMTLRLAESKPEDLWIRPPRQGDANCDNAGFASLLVGKPKRGQARKRRQKRDFQKDILPGLASLSRHEATEDLQVIGGLMRASGQPWEMGLNRRTGGRTSRARGGRRARGGSTAATRPKALPSPAARPDNAEAVINGTSMVGWGRTRRCRRARCPSGTVAPLLPKE